MLQLHIDSGSVRMTEVLPIYRTWSAQIKSKGECLRVSAYKNRPKSPINGTSQKIDFACILPIERS